MSHIKEIYSSLAKLQFNFTYDICASIFTVDTDHYWNKWSTSNENIILFINRLDVLNQEKILSWVENNK